MDNSNIFPVILCLAKNEYNYIEEFVKYHLALGFKHIILYDNQDIPETYSKILEKYLDKMTIFHVPGNDHELAIQYMILKHFNEIVSSQIKNTVTHVAHIDIDEYITLKKHPNIIEFIKEYIKGDCTGIGMNWRFFGSSGHTTYSTEPITKRFTKCDSKGDKHIKTLCDIRHLVGFINPHIAQLKEGYIKSTNGDILYSPFNPNICLDVIQLNHYKCKTFHEYKIIRMRGRADFKKEKQVPYDLKLLEEEFKSYDLNETEDLTAKQFYESII
jgi:hypothetical protein